MKVLAEVAIATIGSGPSASDFIASCKKIFEECKLKHEMHALGTNVEGEWDEVLAAVRRCHEVVHGLGVPRLSTRLQLETQVDGEPTLGKKVRSVEAKLQS